MRQFEYILKDIKREYREAEKVRYFIYSVQKQEQLHK